MSIYKGDVLIAGSADIKTQVLWINPSPTSSFANQTITTLQANPINFDFIYIEFYNAQYGNRYSTLTFQPDNTNYEMNCVHSSGSSVYVWYRPVKATDGSIAFGDCYRGTNGSEGLANNSCIPVKIIGIKTMASSVTSSVNDTVVEQYISSDKLTWYRIWASGWKECGVFATRQTWGLDTVYLPVTFSDTNYTALASFNADSNGTLSQACQMGINSKATNYVTLYFGNTTDLGKSVYCCGY